MDIETKRNLKDLNKDIPNRMEPTELIRFLLYQPINELLFENFSLYIPRLYETILKEIRINEHVQEIAIMITYTEKTKTVWLLVPDLHMHLTKETQRLVQLNNMHVIYTAMSCITHICEHTTYDGRKLQLLGRYTEQREIVEVIALHYYSNDIFKFSHLVRMLEQYRPSSGMRYNLLTQTVAVYSLSKIQEAIEYENIMNLYEIDTRGLYETSSESDTTSDEQDTELVRVEILRKLSN